MPLISKILRDAYNFAIERREHENAARFFARDMRLVRWPIAPQARAVRRCGELLWTIARSLT